MRVERLNGGTLGQTVLGVLPTEEKMLQTLPHSARMLLRNFSAQSFYRENCIRLLAYFRILCHVREVPDDLRRNRTHVDAMHTNPRREGS